VVIGMSTNLGYIAVFLLVFGESAGIPLPGETSLIAASALAAQGQLNLPVVLAAALAAAVLGDNLGYIVGRHAGQRILTARGPFAAHRARLLVKGDAFFTQHGAMAVFLGRWTPVLRVTAALLAGTHKMPWRRFLIWNTLGGAGWVIVVGLLAFALGGRVPGGLLGVGFAVTALGLVALLMRMLYRRGRGRLGGLGRNTHTIRNHFGDPVRVFLAGVTLRGLDRMPRPHVRRLHASCAAAVTIGVLVLAGVGWIDVV